jgi:hypothetical protein
MMQQVLAPGVEYGEKTDLGAEMARVAGDGEERLGGGAEQQAVNHLLVMKGNGGGWFGQSEDDVKVLDRE